MAVTKIWKVKDRLDSTIHYAVNGEKTEEKLYVSGINCMPDTSYQEMINVKKQFFKTDGIQCFHAVQSFVKGEVTPKQAHEIGVQLAEEIWGDKFQVVITTHLNTDNIHNHFVINSISFIDGKRFCNTKKDYAIMRNTSDKLCEEYGLNILKHEKQTDRYNKFATSSLYKELMRDSIDYAVANAKDYNEFIKILQDLDYVITDKNEKLSIRGEPYKRNTRIERQFRKNYSKENIYKRILETQPPFGYLPKPHLLITKTRENHEELKAQIYPKKGSLAWLFLHYMKLLHPNTENVLKSNSTRMTPELLHAIKEMDEFSNQVRFACKNNINTEQELLDYQKSAYEKINPLKSERENLWRKHKRAKTDEEKATIENQIVEISKKITPLAEEIRLCENILKRLEIIERYELHQKLEEERKMAEREQNKKKDKIR